MLHNANGCAGVRFPEKNRYEGKLYVISIMRGWMGVKYPENSVTRMTLLSLRGGGWVSNFQQKTITRVYVISVTRGG